MNMYTNEQKKFLLDLARRAIENYLNTGRSLEIDKKKIETDLKKNRGVFVTLTINGNLKGCIGHIIPIQSLYKDVIDNAIGAAFDDTRFTPLTKEEFNHINIEISILSLPKKLAYKNYADLIKKITPHKDGVIVKKGYNQATYLPQVWEDLSDKSAFLSSLCSKAGLPYDEWKNGELEIEIYTVEKFEEN